MRDRNSGVRNLVGYFCAEELEAKVMELKSQIRSRREQLSPLQEGRRPKQLVELQRALQKRKALEYKLGASTTTDHEPNPEIG